MVRAAVPAGFMVSGEALTLTICSDASGGMMTQSIPIPGDSDDDMAPMDQPCAFAALGVMAMGGVDAPLLLVALAFILSIGFTAAIVPRVESRIHLRPPPIGPPSTL